MTTSKRLAAFRAAPLVAADDAEEQDRTRPEKDEEDVSTAETESDGSTKKEKPMANITQEDHEKAIAAATESAKKSANSRFNTVLASEEYKGREELAATLLETELTAEQINHALAKAPKNAAEAQGDGGKSEADDREKLRKNLADSQPQSLGNEGGDKPKADEADPVIKAAAKVNQINGHK